MVRGAHPFNAADMAQRTSAELLRRSREHFAPRRFPDSLGWSGHQIVKPPSGMRRYRQDRSTDAHVVAIKNREQFGTFVPGTQQLT